MEQDPSKPKIEVTEIQEEMKSADKTISDIEKQLNSLMDDLEHNANLLETKILFAEIEDSNKDFQDVGASYSPEKAEELKQDIIKSLATIHILQEQIMKLHSDREDVENIKLRLQTLQEDYKKQLVSISEGQQN